MYVYMYVCMYVRTYVYIFTSSKQVHIYVIYIYIYIRLPARGDIIYIHTHTHTHIYIYYIHLPAQGDIVQLPGNKGLLSGYLYYRKALQTAAVCDIQMYARDKLACAHVLQYCFCNILFTEKLFLVAFSIICTNVIHVTYY
jgi:hypothetical protein